METRQGWEELKVWDKYLIQWLYDASSIRRTSGWELNREKVLERLEKSSILERSILKTLAILGDLFYQPYVSSLFLCIRIFTLSPGPR